jgi:SAM-dependent methyltransferase
MSEADREKWNARYRGTPCACLAAPNALLLEWLPKLERELGPGSRTAVDVACGQGRHVLYLARRGWTVDAMDISEVALEQLAAVAAAEALAVGCHQRDFEPPAPLEASPFEADRYDLAVVIRYTNLPLMPYLAAALRPGGYLVTEVYLKPCDRADGGPRNPDYRVTAGALKDAVAGLETVEYRERIAKDREGRPAPLAQVVARRPR